MPTNAVTSVTVIKSFRDYKDYHLKKDPNVVLFSPSGKSKSQYIISTNRVHFDNNIRNCSFRDDNRPLRPQSAHILNCQGFNKEEVIVGKRPQSAKAITDKPQRPVSAKRRLKSENIKQYSSIEDQTKRPMSAKTFKDNTQRPPSGKRRPMSATVKPCSNPEQLANEIAEVVVSKKIGKCRVWRPKKKENGIVQFSPPPAPVHQKEEPRKEDPRKEAEEVKKPKHNGLAQFPRFKYPKNFHKYGANSKVSRDLIEIPNCLKHHNNYWFAPTRQSCRYKPFASVTTVSHHQIGSSALPHPIREATTPIAPSNKDDLHLELADALAEIDAEDEDVIDNNGSYCFKHDDNNIKDLSGNEEDEEYTDECDNSDTHRSTRPSTARTERQENTDEFYFASNNPSRVDSKKANNTKSLMEDIQEVGEAEPRPRSGRSVISSRSVTSLKSWRSVQSVQSGQSRQRPGSTQMSSPKSITDIEDMSSKGLLEDEDDDESDDTFSAHSVPSEAEYDSGPGQ